MNAVTANNIRLRLKRKEILKDVSFEVPEGVAFGVVGHNGAGKTCLFHILLGLKFQSAGSVAFFSVDALEPKARERLGFVPERPYVQLEQTFRTFLKLHASLSGFSGDLNQELNRVVSEVGLTGHLDDRLSTFSKGMLQKAIFAQASIGNPAIYILDEPMSGLDPESREAVRARIEAWKKTGKTIIFSSHALEDVERLADQVLVLEQGKVSFCGALSDWKARP